jgi:hypothetical protein
MKTLYSLGDSYMSTDDPDEGIVSFCELYSRAKNFEHVSLARPGATNFATRLQIDRAIEDRADYVVIGITCSDRFDIALDITESVMYSLENVFYSNYRAQSQRHVQQDSVKLVSDTFNNLVARLHQKTLVTEQQMHALKAYIAYLHNPMLVVQKEYYMISDGLHRLIRANIPFVLLPGYMSHMDWSWVPRVWPKDVPGPYHLPYGPSDWENPPRFTNTHNPAWAHEEFCESLLRITQDWR